MPKPIKLWEIMVPTVMNGNPVRTKHHRNWDNFVRNISGGLTLMKPATGQWIKPDDKVLYVERVIPVRIACTDNQIHKIIDFTINHYKQHAVMAYCVSEHVIIKHREAIT